MLKMSKNFLRNLIKNFMEKIKNKNFSKIFFHEIPNGTSFDFNGIFLGL